jgi:hypothetical protein
MDIAVDLVEAYLRINGYFTVSELEIQREVEPGVYQTLTDVDILAVRFPGPVFIADSHGAGDAPRLAVEDETLLLEDDTVDVIIGEVKQGEAMFNPALTDHHTLHTVLQRVAWLFQADVHDVARDLEKKRVCHVPARGVGRVRARLVAFGRAPECNVNVISLTHIFKTMIEQFETFDEALKPAQFKNPAAAMIRLLVKTGFDIDTPLAEYD